MAIASVPSKAKDYPILCIVKLEIACFFFLQIDVRIGKMFLPFVNMRLVERNDLLKFRTKTNKFTLTRVNSLRS